MLALLFTRVHTRTVQTTALFCSLWTIPQHPELQLLTWFDQEVWETLSLLLVCTEAVCLEEAVPPITWFNPEGREKLSLLHVLAKQIAWRKSYLAFVLLLWWHWSIRKLEAQSLLLGCSVRALLPRLSFFVSFDSEEVENHFCFCRFSNSDNIIKKAFFSRCLGNILTIWYAVTCCAFSFKQQPWSQCLSIATDTSSKVLQPWIWWMDCSQGNMHCRTFCNQNYYCIYSRLFLSFLGAVFKYVWRSSPCWQTANSRTCTQLLLFL